MATKTFKKRKCEPPPPPPPPAAATPQEAPTFDTARVELYNTLNEWTFGRVLRPCTIPADARKVVGSKEVVTYFHGIAVEHVNSRAPRRIWFKKHVGAGGVPRDAFIGPVRLVAPASDFIPRVGEVLTGKVIEEPPAHEGDHEARRKPRGCKYVVWFPGAGHLRLLFDLVCSGTTLTELELARDLRTRNDGSKTSTEASATSTTVHFSKIRKPKQVVVTPGERGGDDTWALARLILFGNVEVFAAEHRAPPGAADAPLRMNLSCAPLQFVYSCSKFFRDDTIWARFKTLVPDAEEPEEEDEEDATTTAYTHTVARDKYYTPKSPTYAPASPAYAPASPAYDPSTPPPASPPYDPSTPPASPPPYDPSSPPPSSPPYDPGVSSPPYDPGVSSPPYDPGVSSPRRAYDLRPVPESRTPATATAADLGYVGECLQGPAYDPFDPPIAAAVVPPPFSIETLRSILREVAEVRRVQM